MEDVLTSQEELRRTSRIRKLPFERVMQNLGPHFDLPSYASEQDSRAGGKVSRVVLSPAQYRAVGMGSDANSQLPSAINDARQSYPQAYFKAGHLLNADLGGDGKDPKNLTILTARANSGMTAFDNNVKYALAALHNLYKEMHNLYKEMHKQEDVSTWTYGLQVTISVSAEKWGTAYPENCIAQSLTATVAPHGQAPALPNGTRAHTLHQTFLKYINLANANGTISNAKPLPQASPSHQPAGKPQKRKATETPSDNVRGGKQAKAEPDGESTLSPSEMMDISPDTVATDNDRSTN